MQVKANTINDYIRLERISRGLKQYEVAEKLNLSRSYYTDLENGRYNPSIKTLVDLAVMWDLDLNFLKDFKKEKEIN